MAGGHGETEVRVGHLDGGAGSEARSLPPAVRRDADGEFEHRAERRARRRLGLADLPPQVRLRVKARDGGRR